MPLRYVDPHRLGSGLPTKISTSLALTLCWAMGGRFTTSMGVVVNAPLVTIGVKSGQPREVRLTYFHDGPG
jgi:hypothetical protein